MKRRRPITIDGETRTIAEWCRYTGIGRHTFYDRIKAGWSERKALSTGPYAAWRKPPKSDHVDVLGLVGLERDGKNTRWRYRCRGCGDVLTTVRQNIRRIRGCMSCSVKAWWRKRRAAA